MLLKTLQFSITQSKCTDLQLFIYAFQNNYFINIAIIINVFDEFPDPHFSVKKNQNQPLVHIVINKLQSLLTISFLN